MIGDAIYSILYNDATVQSYVSNKIYPLIATQGTVEPFITYQIISIVSRKNKDRDVKLDIVRIQINVFSKDYEELNNITDAVRSALEYFSGTVEGEEIEIIIFEDQNDLFVENSEVYHIEQDYFLRIKK